MKAVEDAPMSTTAAVQDGTLTPKVPVVHILMLECLKGGSNSSNLPLV
jgi:hypothetical protein